ncbi:DnaJ domain-containing protein [Parachlamydia acanthamoebae]|uniref:DnaJ domain-containing protein n=1 Tax=Parachlamydia acanthamoebae TaxID=83552 RepID=UPI0001C177B3|nr:DnaJ domain-containing protein [Parachlamydia acanthamoebae]EFB40393.1 hypothetical protein pah_c205o024 [Parachlamydia acanthamoebae str. Hall's coccus]
MIPAVLDRFSESTDFTTFQPISVQGRKIYRFKFSANSDEIEKFTDIILNFLKENKERSETAFIPTFKVTRETLKNKFIKHPVQILIFNAQTVSLTHKQHAPSDAQREIKDTFFTNTLLTNPVCCMQNHQFEKKRLEAWFENGGKNCPAGSASGEHGIDTLEIDSQIKDMIISYHAEKKKKAEILSAQEKLKEKIDNYEVKNAELTTAVSKLSIDRLRQYQQSVDFKKELQLQKREINFLRQLKNLDPWTIVGALSKVVVKVGGKHITISLCKALAGILTKEGTKEAGKALGKSIVKKIPFVSLAIGIALGCYRFYNGEWIRGVGEIVSGAFAMIPIWGTAVSMLIDISLVGTDMYEAMNQKDNRPPSSPTVQIELKGAYEALGLEDNPTKEDVDNAWKALSKELHPDTSMDLGEHAIESFTELTTFLNVLKDFIYRERKWD